MTVSPLGFDLVLFFFRAVPDCLCYRLYPFKHLRKEADGLIVYKTGSEHQLKNVSPLSNGDLLIFND